MPYPHNAFITYEKPKRIISIDRYCNAYKETSVIEIHEVLAAGIPMFCMTQRRGTRPTSEDDRQRYGLLTPNFQCLKELVDIWRCSYMVNCEGTVEAVGVSWNEFYNALDEDREHGKDWRVRFTTNDLEEEVGYLYSVDGYRNGIIRTAEDATFYNSRQHAELSMYGCGMQLQVVNFRETVNYLIDLHGGKHLIAHLEKRVGESWVAQPEKQFVMPFTGTTEEFYDYKSL